MTTPNSTKPPGGAWDERLYGRTREEVVSAVCEHVKTGTPLTHACDLESVPRSTFYAWMELPEFGPLVAKARALGAERARKRLIRLARGGGPPGANPNVLLHLMERLYPDSYSAPPKRVEQSGPGGKPIETSTSVTISRDEALPFARKKDT